MKDRIKSSGRPSRGTLGTVYARLAASKYEILQRIREEKGWSLVTAIERAVDALAKQEGYTEQKD
jgi:hypothetical protein